jgi:hypothetical protein
MKEEITILEDGRILETTTSVSGIVTKKFYSPKQWQKTYQRRMIQQNIFDGLQIFAFCVLTFLFVWFFNTFTPLINYVFNG